LAAVTVNDDPSWEQADAAAGTDWTSAEVSATVADYLAMLTEETAGQNYSKTVHRRALSRQLSANRTTAAIEFKHQNISAAMVELGLPYIRGYKPRGNYQEALLAEIRRRLEQDPHLLDRLQPTLTDAPTTRPPLQRTEAPSRRPGNRGRSTPGSKAGRHVDYGLLQEENRQLGALGEELVVDYERRWLQEHDRRDLADRVQWAARDHGDGLGYDILSYDAAGHERYIEVKTTTLGAETPFYISSAELEFARHHQQAYALYRVYTARANPKFFMLDSHTTLQLDLTAVTYKANLPVDRPAPEPR
jgi:hypothetical protein